MKIKFRIKHKVDYIRSPMIFPKKERTRMTTKIAPITLTIPRMSFVLLDQKSFVVGS